MKIVISPFSTSLRISNNKPHPKNPSVEWWKRVIKTLKRNHEIIQIGVDGEEILTFDFRFNLKMSQLVEIVQKEMDLFISVDNFFQHMCHFYYPKFKKNGIVIFSQSDPKIFSYPENVNLLKDKKYLRKDNDQFLYWDQANYIEGAFVDPEEVIRAVNEMSLKLDKPTIQKEESRI